LNREGASLKLAGIVSILSKVRNYHVDRWLPGLGRAAVSRALSRTKTEGPRHLLFALCDHYEPHHGNADVPTGRERVRVWHEGYPKLAESYRDADGRPPRHGFFFPGEEYRPEYLDALADLAKRGFGEVEVHLHHDADTEETLTEKFQQTLKDLSRHGHISRDAEGRMRWAFIHGNWALANPRSDGKWCGVDAELPLLHRLGCYADFTFPSVPDECQPNIANQIYWPTGNLDAKRCYEQGERARVGEVKNDRLLLVQGPMGIYRPTGTMKPRIEGSALTANDPATPKRVRNWTKSAIHIEGRPEWVFAKLHTHGAPEKQAASLLGEGGHALHRILTTQYNDGRKWVLHYVTAREMFNIAIAAMEGKSGNPNDYRDHVLPPPPVAR
jgi:hypothetical protein